MIVLAILVQYFLSHVEVKSKLSSGVFFFYLDLLIGFIDFSLKYTKKNTSCLIWLFSMILHVK